MSTRNTLAWNGIDDFYLHDVVLSNVSANKFIFFFFAVVGLFQVKFQVQQFLIMKS